MKKAQRDRRKRLAQIQKRMEKWDVYFGEVKSSYGDIYQPFRVGQYTVFKPKQDAKADVAWLLHIISKYLLKE